MGRYIVQYFIPAVVCITAAWYLWRVMWLRWMPTRIARYKESRKAAKQYEKELKRKD